MERKKSLYIEVEDFRTLNLKMCCEIMYNNHLVMNMEKKNQKKKKIYIYIYKIWRRRRRRRC